MIQGTSFLRDIATLRGPQLKAIESMFNYPFTLYGGEAGGGKTRTLVSAAGYMVMKYGEFGHSRARAILATSDNKRVLTRFYQEIYDVYIKHDLGRVHGDTKDAPAGFSFNDKRLGGISFTGLREAASTFKGWADVVMVGVDELTEIEEDVFHDVYWRLRFADEPDPFEFQPFLATSNPDGPGSHWVNEYFVKKTFEAPLAENFVKEYGAAAMNFIPGKLSDNPNARYREKYLRRLRAQPEHLRRARMDGIWDAAKGARFKWNPRTIRWTDPPLNGSIPLHWQIFTGNDWGFHDPTACIAFAFDELKNCYVFFEYVEGGYSVPIAVRRIMERLQSRYWKPVVNACDPTMFATSPIEMRDIASVYREEGMPLIASTNDHSIGNTMIEKYMEPNNGYPDIFFVEGECPNLIMDLKAVRFDKEGRNPENLVPHRHTHTVYALGYGLHRAWPYVQAPKAPGDPLAEARVKEFEEKWQKQKARFR